MNEIPDPQDNKNDLLDEERRRFLLTSACVLGGMGAVCAITPFVSSLLPSAKAQANGAPVEVDLSQLGEGEQTVVEWRGKPIWIIRRTKEMLQNLSKHDSRLRDPYSLTNQQPSYAKNEYRSINPDYLILVGICTHLGCSPKYKPALGELDVSWPGGFYCPCHGSTFDLSGRVFKDVPAPINLEVPPHYFRDKYTLVIGKDSK